MDEATTNRSESATPWRDPYDDGVPVGPSDPGKVMFEYIRVPFLLLCFAGILSLLVCSIILIYFYVNKIRLWLRYKCCPTPEEEEEIERDKFIHDQIIQARPDIHKAIKDYHAARWDEIRRHNEIRKNVDKLSPEELERQYYDFFVRQYFEQGFQTPRRVFVDRALTIEEKVKKEVRKQFELKHKEEVRKEREDAYWAEVERKKLLKNPNRKHVKFFNPNDPEEIASVHRDSLSVVILPPIRSHSFDSLELEEKTNSYENMGPKSQSLDNIRNPPAEGVNAGEGSELKVKFNSDEGALTILRNSVILLSKRLSLSSNSSETRRRSASADNNQTKRGSTSPDNGQGQVKRGSMSSVAEVASPSATSK